MITRHEIAVLACKILAIYTFIHFLDYLPIYIPLFSSGLLYEASALLSISLYLFFCAFLWFGSDFIAKRMTGGGAQKSEFAAGALNQEGLLAAAFPVVGLFVLTNAVPRLIGFLVIRNQMGQFTDIPRAMQAEMSASQISQVVSMAAQFCIGLYLLFGSNGLLRLLKKLRASN